MKVVQWNVSKMDMPMTALRKYEDNLYRYITELIEKDGLDVKVERIRRSDDRLFGSTVVSWVFSYRKNNADVVHATFQTLAPAGLIKRPRRFIVTVHDLAPMRFPYEIRDISEKIQWMLTPKAIKDADHIIAISEFTKEEMLKLLNIDEDKIVVIYQGVDHDLYRPMNKDACREHFRLDPNRRYILYVASNLPHKRVDLAKTVFERVREHRNDVMMIKAGYSERLVGNGIVSMGWIDERDMPKLYNCADVYLHTSEYEGFGLPVLEAMACGVPIVALRRASIPEVVGKVGVLADDIDELVEGILKTLDSCEDVDKKAIRRSMEFSWKRTAKKTLELYLR